MKILFIEKKLRTDKLGILYLSAVLKKAGHSVDMIQDDIDNADSYLSRNPADFIMYSVMTGEHNWFISKNRELKNKFKFTSVVGGPHFTFFPEDGMDDPAIDYIVQGPGEEIITDLVEHRVNNKLIKGPLPKIEALPFPDRSILYKYDDFGKASMKRFIATRYCLFNCSYCFNHLFKKLYNNTKDLHHRTPPAKIIEEILIVKSQYGLKTVYFNDDDLAGDISWLREFCQIYTKKINLPYCGSIRASSVDEESVKLMADSGAVFMNIALESANPSTQKYLRRGNITNDQVIKVSHLCMANGIKIRLQNMIGLPVDDPLKDALDTLALNIEINPTDSWVAVFQPLPKTDIWKDCVDKGLIDSATQTVNFYESTQLRIKDAEKINRLHKWWYFIVKYHLPMDLVKILLEIDLSTVNNSIQDLRWAIAKKELYNM